MTITVTADVALASFSIMGFAGTLILIGIIHKIILWRKEVNKWNNGVCDFCYNGIWKRVPIWGNFGDSTWVCNSCGYHWLEKGYGKKTPLNPHTSQRIIRSMKLKNIKKNMKK